MMASLAIDEDTTLHVSPLSLPRNAHSIELNRGSYIYIVSSSLH